MSGTRLPSPRSRILSAATHLFYRQGINATGIGELVDVAGVSKRTLYQLFDSKDELVAAYLTMMSRNELPTNEDSLTRTELTPGQRLLGLFDPPRPGTWFRGCPLHNASIELADPTHQGRAVIAEHKRDFLRRLVDTAREAGADDAETLGRQLCALFEGAMALSTSLDDLASFDYARSAAMLLTANEPGIAQRSPARDGGVGYLGS
jgi:AcrR family transcriptional regulator